MRTLILAFLLTITAASCTVTFVPKYSQSIVDQVTATAKKTDSLYSVIQLSSNKSFATYAPTYAAIESSMTSIVLQDAVRNKPTLILSQAQAVLDMFVKYEKEHQAKGNITAGEAQSYRNGMAAMWQPLLISETHLNK
jgi:hypothetical protein